MRQLSRKIWNVFPYRDSLTVQNIERASVQDNRAWSVATRNVVISIGNAQSTLDECRHTRKTGSLKLATAYINIASFLLAADKHP